MIAILYLVECVVGSSAVDYIKLLGCFICVEAALLFNVARRNEIRVTPELVDRKTKWQRPRAETLNDIECDAVNCAVKSEQQSETELPFGSLFSSPESTTAPEDETFTL